MSEYKTRKLPSFLWVENVFSGVGTNCISSSKNRYIYNKALSQNRLTRFRDLSFTRNHIHTLLVFYQRVLLNGSIFYETEINVRLLMKLKHYLFS